MTTLAVRDDIWSPSIVGGGKNTEDEWVDDASVAREAQNGSAQAFGILVKRHHGRVFAFLFALTRHREDAEDLTQETFLRAWDKFHRFDQDRPLLPWLFTIARRLSISALRKRKPIPCEAVPAADIAPENDRCDPGLWELAKAELPPESFEAVWLHYCEELSIKEIAAIMGKREGAVKVSLHRSRKTLAARLRLNPTFQNQSS